MSGIPFKKNNMILKKLFNLFLFAAISYIGWIFISASLDKIVDPSLFSKSISNYEITPYWINNLLALFLPWVELICGILMFVGLYYFFKNKSKLIDIPNNIIILMLLWFIFILSVAVYRDLDIDCGCGISDDKTTPFEKLIEDIYLLITSIIIKFRLRITSFLNRKN
jgi:uncharacterized membrane protein YphA (DoxX/SURF4 family)